MAVKKADYFNRQQIQDALDSVMHSSEDAGQSLEHRKSSIISHPSREDLELMRKDFPEECRIVLDQMLDPYTLIPSGSQGTCRGVDDAGSILVNWDCGSSLNVIYAVDRCHKLHTDAERKTSIEYLTKKEPYWKNHCPRCGRKACQNNKLLALSRNADIQVCEECGTWEAMEDASLTPRKELSDWSIFQKLIKEKTV